MCSSDKFAPKIFTTFCMVVFSLSVTANSANTIPTAEDINSLAETARLSSDAFMHASFKLRLGYEYSGKFLQRDDKNKLCRLAKKASDQLQAVTKKQRELKKQIEDYQGEDWDTRYGSTGLWRKLRGDLYATTLSKCEVDYYLALSSEQPERNKILHGILAEMGSLNRTYDTAYAHFSKAKTFALLSRTDSAYKPLAKKEFDALFDRSDIRHSTAFRIAIERIKLIGLTKASRLDELAEELAKSKCVDDLDLVLSLASLSRSLNRPEAFEKIVRIWPQTEDFLSSLALSELSYRIADAKTTEQDLSQISVFEAELAAQAAWEDTAQDHKMLLDHLSSTEKFQTPLIMYVAAAAFAEASPANAVNLLIKASKLQQLQKSSRLQISSEKIAKQACELAYDLFVEDPLNCLPALKAFENYYTIANSKMDEEPEYVYSIVLNNCGLRQKGKKLLQKIADRPAGKWRNRAKLDLIVQAIQQNKHANQDGRSKLLTQLSELIADCRQQDENDYQLRTEAVTVYCRLLLEANDKDSAQKVLDIMTEAEITSDPNLNFFKAKALRQLGRLNESAKCLLGVVDPNRCEHATEAMELLSEVIGEVDRLQAQSDAFGQMMQNYKGLAEYSYSCLEDAQKRRAGLLLVEIAVFAADKDKEKLSAAEKLLNNLAKDNRDSEADLLRCRARLLTEQDKFNEAARLWARICRIRKSESPSANQRSWKWWRAKFYELHCWSKLPQTEKEQVLHTIEVLENSFTDIPPLWARKLSSLRQQIK